MTPRGLSLSCTRDIRIRRRNRPRGSSGGEVANLLLVYVDLMEGVPSCEGGLRFIRARYVVLSSVVIMVTRVSCPPPETRHYR